MSAASTLAVPALARLRGRSYRLLGASFLYPAEERLARLVALARALRRSRARAAVLGFYAPWSRWIDDLVEAAHAPERLRQAFMRTFLIEPEAGPCVPQESAYAGGAGATGALVGGLEHEYVELGLAMAGTGEPADHVAVELELMALLCATEAAAWARDEPEAVRLLARQRRFLDEHLARWLPPFAARLAASPDAGVYRALAVAADAFVRHDRQLIDLVASVARDAA